MRINRMIFVSVSLRFPYGRFMANFPCILAAASLLLLDFPTEAEAAAEADTVLLATLPSVVESSPVATYIVIYLIKYTGIPSFSKGNSTW